MENAVEEMRRLTREWEDMLPSWAIKKATAGLLELGAQLPTKDGRRMGNAHIIEVTQSKFDHGRPYYVIITDAGQRATMNSTEIYGQFHPPCWISDVKEILRKFDRNDDLEMAEPEPEPEPASIHGASEA